MKTITLIVDEDLIEIAEAQARARKTTLDELFREWLKGFAKDDQGMKKADEVIENLSKHLSFDRKFTREEMNER